MPPPLCSQLQRSPWFDKPFDCVADRCLVWKLHMHHAGQPKHSAHADLVLTCQLVFKCTCTSTAAPGQAACQTLGSVTAVHRAAAHSARKWGRSGARLAATACRLCPYSVVDWPVPQHGGFTHCVTSEVLKCASAIFFAIPRVVQSGLPRSLPHAMLCVTVMLCP